MHLSKTCSVSNSPVWPWASGIHVDFGGDVSSISLVDVPKEHQAGACEETSKEFKHSEQAKSAATSILGSVKT